MDSSVAAGLIIAAVLAVAYLFTIAIITTVRSANKRNRALEQIAAALNEKKVQQDVDRWDTEKDTQS